MVRYRTRSEVCIPYSMLGKDLSRVSSNPYLGVLFHEDMTWSPHIQATVAKAKGTLAFLSRNLYGCPEVVKRRAYITMSDQLLNMHPQYGTHLPKLTLHCWKVFNVKLLDLSATNHTGAMPSHMTVCLLCSIILIGQPSRRDGSHHASNSCRKSSTNQ